MGFDATHVEVVPKKPLGCAVYNDMKSLFTPIVKNKTELGLWTLLYKLL
jgi:hypothetical protein